MPEASEVEIISDLLAEQEEAGSALKESQLKRLADIAKALRDGESIPPITVRSFLSWFWHSQRRGRWIVSYIRNLLDENGLVTVPDFESTYLDAEIEFDLTPEEAAVLESVEESRTIETVVSKEVLEVPTKQDSTDPTYRISKLAAANRSPVIVAPTASLEEAVTLMLSNDFSQLPVGSNDRDMRGVISWKSIGTRLGLGQKPLQVREAMEPYAEVSSEASLFAVIPVVVEHDYALVRGTDRRIVGIITTSDLSTQFQQLSEPFLLLGEIENHIRRIINLKFEIDDLCKVRDPKDVDRKIDSVADLTFGEYRRLLEDPEQWNKLDVRLDRSVFVKILDKVRNIRNDVMHFDPDGIEDTGLVALRDFAKLLRTLQSIGAT